MTGGLALAEPAVVPTIVGAVLVAFELAGSALPLVAPYVEPATLVWVE
jgi:hypothetical protein